jgi:hypothetical protein
MPPPAYIGFRVHAFAIKAREASYAAFKIISASNAFRVGGSDPSRDDQGGNR